MLEVQNLKKKKFTGNEIKYEALKGINLTGPRLGRIYWYYGTHFWKWEKSTLLEFIGNSNPDSPTEVKYFLNGKNPKQFKSRTNC